ncbi:MAG: hypothetical protein M3256_04550 [Actinomycetota bacterium]|nr:hypothetical protein [Actinomycetota bacterium]
MSIQDNPSFKDLSNAGKAVRYASTLAALAKIFGKDGRAIAAALREGARVAAKAAVLLPIPDAFNRHYRSRGWIAFGDMHADAMQEAVRLAETGDVEAGEKLLVQTHSIDRLRFLMFRLCSVKAFLPRKGLIELALEDHVSGRFHASVPVVLAQIDGLVFDVAEASFYETREKKLRHLEAKDTIAGHPEGLMSLAQEMSKTRPRTTTSVLSLPYRNGILHGRDLGYANETVSVKAFCALAALGDWARAWESGKAQVEPPLQWLDPDEATWNDVRRLWNELVTSLHNRADASSP